MKSTYNDTFVSVEFVIESIIGVSQMLPKVYCLSFVDLFSTCLESRYCSLPFYFHWTGVEMQYREMVCKNYSLKTHKEQMKLFSLGFFTNFLRSVSMFSMTWSDFSQLYDWKLKNINVITIGSRFTVKVPVVSLEYF